MRIFQILALIILIQIFIPIVLSEEITTLWDGDSFTVDEALTKKVDLNSVLDKEKANKISQGISEGYFKRYFDLLSVKEDETGILLNFSFNIVGYNATVRNTTQLHEITKILTLYDSITLLKNCIGDYEVAETVLNHDGTLHIEAISSDKRYKGAINLETAKCQKDDLIYGTKTFYENPYVTPVELNKSSNSPENHSLIYFLISFSILAGLILIKIKK